MFKNPNFVNFRAIAQLQGYEVFGLIQIKKTLQVITAGDNTKALNDLKEMDNKTRKTSNEWIPSGKVLELPMPFRELVRNLKDLRAFASVVLHRYLNPKQGLGQVTLQLLK